MLRSTLLVPALAAFACQSSLPHTPPPTVVVTAVFDPLAAKIPLPNDLAFQNHVNTVCPTPSTSGAPACAQAELLASFLAAGGAFPSDQEVAITIDFTQTNIDASNTQTQVAPDLDLTSFTPSTLFVYGVTPDGQGRMDLEPLADADYVKLADHGTLTLHHKGHAPWPQGQYAVFVRGGDDGVKTKAGDAVNPSQVFALIAQGKDMTDPANIGLLRAQLGTTEAALAQGQQLNGLIKLYKDTAYPIADTVFPHQELAVLTTFKIAPVVTNVTIDPARGLVPLPIDLLRDSTGHLSPLAACTLAGAQLSATGTCPSPLAAGFLALDGFSTTGAILGPTSELIKAATVTKTSLQLWDLSDPAHPAQVPPDSLLLEPCEFTSACGSTTALSPVIAIQPAGATSLTPAGELPSVYRTKALKDNTDYAVVMTTDIRDKSDKPIGPGTVAKVVRFANPIVVGGHSALQGIDDATAAALEKMRVQLAPVFTALAAAGTDKSKVAMAYTFHTQTILSQAVQLAALPYTKGTDAAVPTTEVTALTPLDAFKKYGVDATVVPGTGVNDHIDEILEVDIDTFNALDNTTGAFVPDPANQVKHEPIHVLIATPKPDNANIPACTLGKCAPLMIFRHGLGGGRADMLTVADSFAAAGMITVAIDAAKHGDRSFCTSGPASATSGCNGGGECTLLPGLLPGFQGDAHPPGSCGAAGFAKRPVSPTCADPTQPGRCPPATDGIPRVSSNYLVTANFFRTRDSLRQDLIDQSQLIRAIAFTPSGLPPSPSTVFNHIFTHSGLGPTQGLMIDPATIYFSGQSLGSIQGAMDVATNPRISKAAFNVGGGTIVDIFTSSPAFATTTNALLAGLGIDRVQDPAGFLQFLVVAKTILDPADPINFVGHLTDAQKTLPNLLPPVGGNPNGMVRQLPKKVLAQAAHCDAVVPNPFNYIYASNLQAGLMPGLPGFDTGTGRFQLFVPNATVSSTAACSPATGVQHAFLTDWLNPPMTAAAQSDIASFMTDDAFLPQSLRHP